MSVCDEPDITYLNFEWNAEKAKANLKLHGIAFEEAVSVFDDPFFIVFKVGSQKSDTQEQSGVEPPPTKALTGQRTPN